MKNRPLSTSFRSVTQATDSTRSGWTANSAAASALGHKPAGHPPQRQEEEQRGGGVQEDVGEMMSAGPVP